MIGNSFLPYLIVLQIFGATCVTGNRFEQINTVDEYLNMCQMGSIFKETPSPEPDLNDCSEWRNLSCCTAHSTDAYLEKSFSGFDMHHCGTPLPPACMKMFHREFCHAKCSPYLGPWIVKAKSKRFPERPFGIPLCESDCKTWFEACRTGLTCAGNWRNGGFNWKTGFNRCREGFSCQPIESVFSGATDFCERVWDYTWKVVPDNSHVWLDKKPPCIHIDQATYAQHNKRAAEYHAHEILNRVKRMSSGN